jgi:hypothetical protein
MYPRLICVYPLPSESGLPDPNDPSRIVLPENLNPSAENLKADGAYLIEDGHDAILWVGREADPTWINMG